VGIEGTPALVIGGELIPGAVEVAELRKAVTAARAAK
jgi:protein-disulfide isomerase